MSLLKLAGHASGQERIGWPGRGDSDFHHISFYFALPRVLGFPMLGVAGLSQSPASEIQPLLLGCLVIPSGKGKEKGDDPRAPVYVAPVRFLALVPGGVPDVSRQDQAGCPAACPSLAHRIILSPDLRKNVSSV